MFWPFGRMRRVVRILPVAILERGDAFCRQMNEIRKSIHTPESGIQIYEPYLYGYWCYTMAVRNSKFSVYQQGKLILLCNAAITKLFEIDFQHASATTGKLSDRDSENSKMLGPAIFDRLHEYDAKFNEVKVHSWNYNIDDTIFWRPITLLFSELFVGRDEGMNFYLSNFPVIDLLAMQTFKAAYSDLR